MAYLPLAEQRRIMATSMPSQPPATGWRTSSSPPKPLRTRLFESLLFKALGPDPTSAPEAAE